MRVLLISTYELGHQPVQLAMPAAALLAAGHEVRCIDVAVDPLDVTTSIGPTGWRFPCRCTPRCAFALRVARNDRGPAARTSAVLLWAVCTGEPEPHR